MSSSTRKSYTYGKTCIFCGMEDRAVNDDNQCRECCKIICAISRRSDHTVEDEVVRLSGLQKLGWRVSLGLRHEKSLVTASDMEYQLTRIADLAGAGAPIAGELRSFSAQYEGVPPESRRVFYQHLLLLEESLLRKKEAYFRHCAYSDSASYTVNVELLKKLPLEVVDLVKNDLAAQEESRKKAKEPSTREA